ncbi:MAG: shikimate kinase [Alkalilacustris sp.]
MQGATNENSGREARAIVKGRLDRSVALIGMMGAGKTAVGGQLARMLQVPFLDSDEAIEAAANMTVAEIFARDGEAFFRRKESQVIERLLSGPPCVLSTGGGAFLSPDNRRMIAARGVSVWLKVDLELLWARVRQRSTRPLLRTADPRATLAALLEARAPVYALADLTVEAAPGQSVEAMARRVLAALRAHPYIWEG